jgi:tRNA(Leu) C34 or U34 (ribose-2'-O)-methylase TrmL
MAAEIEMFGIQTTIIEPNGYSTDFSGDSGVRSAAIDAYDNFKTVAYEQMNNMPHGNPEATAAVILKVVDAKKPPLRIFFGNAGLPWVKQVYADRLSQWEQVIDLSNEAHG